MGRAKKEENQIDIEEVTNKVEDNTKKETKKAKKEKAVPTEEARAMVKEEEEEKEKEKNKKSASESDKVEEKDVARAKAKKIIEKAKESGKITYGELANQLEDISPDQIDKVFDVFEELGVDV